MSKWVPRMCCWYLTSRLVLNPCLTVLHGPLNRAPLPWPSVHNSSQHKVNLKFQTLSHSNMYTLSLTDWTAQCSWKLCVTLESCTQIFLPRRPSVVPSPICLKRLPSLSTRPIPNGLPDISLIHWHQCRPHDLFWLLNREVDKSRGSQSHHRVPLMVFALCHESSMSQTVATLPAESWSQEDVQKSESKPTHTWHVTWVRNKRLWWQSTESWGLVVTAAWLNIRLLMNPPTNVAGQKEQGL